MAAPFAAAQVGMHLMGLVDVMMVGRLDGSVGGITTEQAMAAVTLGNVYAFGIQVPFMGLLLALDPLVAQAFGARDHRAVSLALWRGLLLATVLAIPLIALERLCSPLLLALRLPEDVVEVVPLASKYVTIALPGFAMQLYFFALRQTLQAMGIGRPVLVTVLVVNVLNVFLNWIFVFGNLGAPALGVEGSAWATTVCRTVMALLLLAWGWRRLKPYLSLRPEGILDVRAFLAMLMLGGPIAVQFGLEIWGFQAVTLLMGKLGTMQVSGHQVALNLAALAFMIPLSVGMAAATRVGQAIGRGDPDAAARSASVSIALGAGVMCISAALFLTMPKTLARAYTPDEVVLAMAVTLLPIAGVFQVFDGVQVVALGALRGAGDTRLPAAINLLGYWGLGLPFGAWLTFERGAGPQGLWWGLTVGLATVSILLCWRMALTFGRLRAGRVTANPPTEE